MIINNEFQVGTNIEGDHEYFGVFILDQSYIDDFFVKHIF